MLLLIALSLAPRAHAAEAKVAFKASLGHLPIWMSLQIAANGQVTGSYFYFKHRTPIALTGTKRGAKLSLQERVGGKITGTFALTTTELAESSPRWPLSRGEKRELSGTWRKPGKRKTQGVNGYESDPTFEACARLNVDELRLAGGGSPIFGETLGTELDFERQNAGPDPDHLDADPPERDYDITGCRNGIFSLAFESVSYAANRLDPTYEMHHQTYDVAAKREIALGDELEVSKQAAFLASLAHRVHAPEDHPLTFYLDGDRLMIGYANPYGSDDPDDVESVVAVPFADLAPYLRKDSVLRALAK